MNTVEIWPTSLEGGDMLRGEVAAFGFRFADDAGNSAMICIRKSAARTQLADWRDLLNIMLRDLENAQ